MGLPGTAAMWYTARTSGTVIYVSYLQRVGNLDVIGLGRTDGVLRQQCSDGVRTVFGAGALAAEVLVREWFTVSATRRQQNAGKHQNNEPCAFRPPLASGDGGVAYRRPLSAMLAGPSQA
jgi:hypothetical protein